MTEQIVVVSDLIKIHFSNFLRKPARGLEGISFTIAKGETFGLLGPNGAGKTTTQKLLLGLLKPTKGSVSVFSKPAGDKEALRRIGYLPENPYFYSYLTALEFLDFFARLFNLSKAERHDRIRMLLEMVALADEADKPIRKYSKGMLQRLGIAQALINDPDLIVLDEPNSGLDPIGRRDVRQIIMKLKGEGKTIFLNSHLLADVNELCDRIVILHRGRCVAEGPVQSIASSGNYRDLEQYFMDTITQAEQEHQLAIATSARSLNEEKKA